MNKAQEISIADEIVELQKSIQGLTSEARELSVIYGDGEFASIERNLQMAICYCEALRERRGIR